MIPLIAAIRVGTRRLAWIPVPLFLVWILLLPLCLLLLPFYMVACRVIGIRAGLSLLVIWKLLVGCRGLRLDVRQGGMAFAVRLI